MINTQLRELILKAGTDVSGKWLSIDNAEKFAELIVKECLDFVESAAAQSDDGSETQSLLLACALDILDHFDIELDESL
jgi:hypothetical protein